MSQMDLSTGSEQRKMEKNQYEKYSQTFYYESRNYESTFLKANFAGVTFPTRNFRVHDPCLKFHVFEYVKAGRVCIEANGKEYIAGPGDIYVLKKGLNVEYYTPKNEMVEKIWFNMRGRLLDKLFEAYELTDEVLVAHCDAENEINKIHSALQSSGSSAAVTCKLALSVHEIIMKISLAGQQLDLSFNPASSMAERLKDFLDARIYFKTSLGFIADFQKATDKYIIRVFKEKYGITPYAYLIQKRMEAAQELLRFTELSVKDIAAKLAFSDGNYFSRAFKKHTGVSPVEYRRQNSRAAR